MYLLMADVYDVMYHFKDYVGETPYLVNKIRAYKPEARNLLEVACGTGRFLEILQQDFKVEGLDLSQPMLDKARIRVGDAPLHLGDMADFDLDRQFDVVCCLFRSIAHCKTAERLQQAIAAMARHVSPGGLLLIEPFFTPETFWDNHVVLNEYKDDDMKLAWMYVGKREGSYVSQNNYFLVGTAEGVSHFTELVELGLYSPGQYAESFAAAGLDMVYDPVGPTGIGFYIGRKPL
ncbi:MAG: class I SAM-dependent methyltransferase [Methylococcales bacterium]|nr:class I SAM-dependent methyltransferase [Methylococcales bacterium]